MIDPVLRDKVRQLAPGDRLDLMLELWKSLDAETLEVSDVEKQILDDRLADLERNPGDEQAWDEFMDNIRDRLRTTPP